MTGKLKPRNRVSVYSGLRYLGSIAPTKRGAWRVTDSASALVGEFHIYTDATKALHARESASDRTGDR